MFIQTEPTPNPEVLKFLPGRDVAPAGAHDFTDGQAAEASPLAAAVFASGGVAGVFLGPDYLAVTRDAGEDWAELKPRILTAVMDHFMSGAPVLLNAEAVSDDGAEDSEVVQEIKALLDSRVRPAVAQDGGDILFDTFDEETGVLTLRMRGACAGCPSSSATLKAGVEQMMRHYVPEVTRVEQSL